MRASHKVGVALVVCYLVAWLDRMAIALTLPSMKAELHLDATTSGWVMSAFFLGYALFQVPGGLLADRFGPRKVILAALAWWSAFTALTGAAASLGSMLLVRFLFGIGEGVFPASVWKVIAGWFSKKNRATANALVLSSIAIGPALTPFVLQPLLLAVGWRVTYVVIGLGGIASLALAWRFVQSSIREGRDVPAAELAQYEADAASAVANVEASGSQSSFGDVVRTPLVWVLFGLGVIGNIGMYGWLQWLPSYLKEAHHLGGTAFMVASSVPWIAASIGCILGGFVSDRFFRGRRKLLVIACQIVGVASLYAFTRAQGSGLATAMAFQCLAGFAFFMGVAAIWSLPMNLLPTRVMGTASGLINTGGQIGGVLSGLVIGWYITSKGGDYARMWDVVIATGLINTVLATIGIREKRRVVPDTGLGEVPVAAGE